jgi:mycofactocin system glycosyltransferase
MTTVPLPVGFRVVPDDLTASTGAGWFGRRSLRIMRLTEPGRAAWRELRDGPVASRAAGLLARRLTDAGLFQPVPPPAQRRADVTVIVPTKDRAALLAQCLAGQGDRYPVVVVDDGSADPAAVAAVADRYGTKLLRRTENGGPGAARNTGLDVVGSEFVAFLDNDCLPTADWVDALLPHFADPLVAAVAPRMIGVAPSTWAGRYTSARCALDLGERPARVAQGHPVPYAPTAALVVRRAALPPSAFDPALRVGEDVDLVWRLCTSGWRIRYVPTVSVRHQDPPTWRGVLGRRFRYGTSVAPLARRHPGELPPVVTSAWLAAAGAALLAGQPSPALVALASHTVTAARGLRAAGLPWRSTARATGTSVGTAWQGMGRYGTQFAAPALLALAVVGGNPVRRCAAASLLLGPPLASWVRRRPRLDPVRYVLGHVADDVAYGLGVLSGCLREATVAPLCPVIT